MHITNFAHLVDTGVLGPVGSHDDVPALDLALRLELQEVGEVVDDSRVVRPGHVRHGREENALLGVAGRDLLGVLGGQRAVPEIEQPADLLLRDGLGRHDALGHDGRVVVVDLLLRRRVREV